MATSSVTQTIPDSLDVELQPVRSHNNNVIEHGMGNSVPKTVKADEIPPLDATPALESWNLPPENKYKVFSAFWSFVVIGMNDGSYGVRDLSWNILNIG